MGLIALIFAVSALLFCVYLWLELQKKLSSADVGGKLQQYSEELSKTYAKQLREIETEWTDMYQKFSRLMGRADKTRGLETAAAAPAAPAAPAAASRSDLLRNRRGGLRQHE